jgi:hypothetical protein
VLRAAEVARKFDCSNQHLLNLISEGSIVMVESRSNWPKASPLVTRNSAAEFLKQRRIS